MDDMESTCSDLQRQVARNNKYVSPHMSSDILTVHEPRSITFKRQLRNSIKWIVAVLGKKYFLLKSKGPMAEEKEVRRNRESQ